MSENNFKRYMGDVEERNEAPSNLRAKVDSTTSFFSFAGNIVEIFLPRIVDFFVVISGVALKDKDKPNSRKTPNNGFTDLRNSPR